MRILYGVQATGNGHITRARVMAPALQKAGIEVDYLFSGRPPQRYFDMQPFGDYQTRTGLTFAMAQGRVRWWQTLRDLQLMRYWQDVRALDLSRYDLVLSDFEPITAWAARKQQVPSVGIAHQYGFLYPVPGHLRPQTMAKLVRWFAPVDQAIGLHWHHFGQPMLPPLIQPPLYPACCERHKVLVYLAFDQREQIARLLRPFHDYQFYIYTDIAEPIEQGHLHFRPFSRDGFQRDLASCCGVICNAGFGLISEAIQYGKKILTRPLAGQLEQMSNARVLEQLGLAVVMEETDPYLLEAWLEREPPGPQCWPDVATVLSQWLAQGAQGPVSEMVAQLWADQTATASVTEQRA
ncbi:MAG: hypothetical protein OIF57_09070 [Marinobacterium sp.]|nr:hypothetical protein [Marinobacterium sp.]